MPKTNKLGVCSVCGRHSKTDPGPICAKKLLNGKITRYQIEANISQKIFQDALKKFEWHEGAEKFDEWISSFSPIARFGLLKTFIFSNFGNILAYYEKKNDIKAVSSLALNEQAKDTRRSFLEHGNAMVRANFIGTHSLTDKELEDGLKDPDQLVFHTTLKHYQMDYLALENVFRKSSISNERKSQLLLHEQCSEELLCEVIKDESKIHMTKDIILFKRKISSKVMRTILSNVDNRVLLKILKKRPDCSPWEKSIDYRIAEIDKIKTGIKKEGK